MSVGNSGIEFDFNKAKSNLIIGKNGSSKSSVLDAICFSLFGKAHRNINKSQLINSVNGKGCLVEIEFSIGSVKYKIVRGMKPNIFEIYQNGNLMNKSSDVRDYQKILEQQILKLNYKTFTQVVILGSASFTPFMQLSPGGRREVIEDILDIGVFSIMSTLNKDRSNQTKEELMKVESDLKTTLTLLETQKKIIKNLTELHQNQVDDINNKISGQTNDLLELSEKLTVTSNELLELQNSISDSNITSRLIEECRKELYKRENAQSTLQEKIEFFDINSKCDSCDQDIPHEHKSSVTKSIKESISKITKESNKISTKLSELETRNNEIANVTRQIQAKNIAIGSINSSIDSINSNIRVLKEDLNKLANRTDSIEEEKLKKKELAQNGMELTNRKTSLIEQQQLEVIAQTLLKDNGIKTSIIREYLPIMNMTINKYLELMDFFVKFELDESFNETIKSRYRDEFTYASFSEGEKQKIDISLLFAWRHIAKLKNSVNTNILFLDEVLNSNLDSGSVELLLNMLDEMKHDSNIFVITHNTENIIDRFDRVIKFEKVGNFSTMTEF